MSSYETPDTAPQTSTRGDVTSVAVDVQASSLAPSHVVQVRDEGEISSHGADQSGEEVSDSPAEEPVTRVVLRRWPAREGGGVIALMPDRRTGVVEHYCTQHANYYGTPGGDPPRSYRKGSSHV